MTLSIGSRPRTGLYPFLLDWLLFAGDVVPSWLALQCYNRLKDVITARGMTRGVALRGGRAALSARIANSLAIEVVGGLLMSVLLPAAVSLLLFDKLLAYQLVVNSIACGGAFLLAVVVSRTMSSYPGVASNAYVLPTFGIVYGIMIISLLLLRAQYSRYLIASGSIIGLAWSYVFAIVRARTRVFEIGLVDFGKTQSIDSIDSVVWHKITVPSEVLPSLDALAADLHAELPDEWESAIAEFVLEGLPVYHVKQLKESLTGQVDLEHLSENSFGSLTPTLPYFQLKRVLDWILAVVLLFPLLPVLAIVAIAVKLNSPGPAIFRQERIGYRGRPFTVYKFRTMRLATNVDDELLAAQTQHGDSRITRLGRFLRATRLDEIPQLFNILRGEMSWIGPRPEAAVLSKWYETQIPFYRYRHVVCPGITGWAQVCQGHVVDVSDVKGKLDYDFYYIKQFSPALDLLIVFRTVTTIFTGNGHR